jgi:hypothetical protein
MADKKISQLTSSGAIGGTEELPIVQGGSTVKTTINAIKTFFEAAGTYLTSANITQTITSGVTDKAPSEDKMFDALALKRSITDEMLLNQTSFVATNLADGQTYFFGNLNQVANTVANRGKFQFANNYTIKKAIITIFQGASSVSNESVSFYLRENNTTDKTITTSLDMSLAPQNVTKVYVISGLNLSVSSGTDYENKLVCPSWAINPNSVFCVIQYYGY